MSFLRTALVQSRAIKSVGRVPAATRSFHSPFTVLGAPQPATTNVAYSEQSAQDVSTAFGNGVYVVAPTTGEFHHVPTGAFSAAVPYPEAANSTHSQGPRFKSQNSAFAHPLSARTAENKAWKAKN
ncbi:hypothetical protein PQX77_017897 [Marasmius sp. AFHP31]|nr:hypothetical protein PQX77_017897 [Marasmius sp. AFHP31]